MSSGCLNIFFQPDLPPHTPAPGPPAVTVDNSRQNGKDYLRNWAMRAITAPAPGKSTLPVDRRALTQCRRGEGCVCPEA